MRKVAKPKKSAEKTRSTVVQSWLQLAQLRSEKCELREAEVAFSMALKLAKRAGDLRSMMEALAGLLRLAGEALNEKAVLNLDRELDDLMKAHPKQIPPMAWHCKGAIASYQKQALRAQRYFHRYIRAVRREGKSEDHLAKGWVMVAITLSQRGHFRRAEWLAHKILTLYEKRNIRSINGITFLLLGNISERERHYEQAWRYYQKAHVSFLGEHNWFYHLYVLYGYARISRLQQNYSQAYWYLDLMDKATSAPEFGLLQREIATERSRLEQDAVDLLIDSRKCLVKTREGGAISLRKQYVLLHILEALSGAHNRSEDEMGGLSKAEIIEKVWKENYRPEAHDNKLYYNINRLRKLIEPDIRKPQYLLNWKEGYRLAPGLRVQFIGSRPSAEIV